MPTRATPATTCRVWRIDVLPDRTAGTLEAWLREHPGVEVVCRDGSTTYAEAIRRALPDAVQVADRWHLWHNLCEAALSEVKAHSSCWATVLDTPIYDGPRAQTTLQRWHQIHDLLDQGVGFLECARRLQLALNTIKRYARADRPERMLRVPKYRAGLVDPYRESTRSARSTPSGMTRHSIHRTRLSCCRRRHRHMRRLLPSAALDRPSAGSALTVPGGLYLVGPRLSGAVSLTPPSSCRIAGAR